jgi:hypothetical protein
MSDPRSNYEARAEELRKLIRSRQGMIHRLIQTRFNLAAKKTRCEAEIAQANRELNEMYRR